MIRAEPIDTKPKSRGIQDMAIGRVDLFRMNPRDLRIEDGWNSRTVDFDPDDAEDIALAKSIAEVGVKQALTVVMKGGAPTITDGHRRLRATLYAMDTLGAEILSVPVQTESKHASEADRVLSQLVRNQGKPLEGIEKGHVYAKLVGFGWSETEIAKKVGASRQHVIDMLALRAGPQAIVEMVQTGEVSATLASQTLKASKGDGAAAAEKLYAGLVKARSEGKTKATAKHVERPAPDLTKSVGYAAGLRRAVEILREAGMTDAAGLVDAATPA